MRLMPCSNAARIVSSASCSIVNLPIVDRPFGGHIVIDVRSHSTHNLSFDHPRIKGDECHLMLFRSRNDLLFPGIVAGLRSASCYESKNEQHSDKL
jgi:hypothetical protein